MRTIMGLAAIVLSGTVLAQDLGQPTPGVRTDPGSWLRPETQNRANEIVGAPWAWSRGWTGLGSGILIIDTGIDVNHPEFRDRIRATLDLSRTGMQDRMRHGTHVAGIAVAASDGRGVQGIAPDSHLYIAKVTDNAAVSGVRVQQALTWAQQFPDIRVANVSANTQFNTTYTRAVRGVGSGVYVSTDRLYRGTTFYNRERPEDWARALGPGMVLTVSAGNQNVPYPQNPASFAAATDAQGRLILRGQMLIVGNWNDRAGRIESARAGHVCRDMVANQCRDPYRTWDFYILAPGMAVNSTVPGGGTQTMSGSSQAAPVVAGAVAVIGQMWPYMPADQVVQLLLRTARRDLPNYHVTTHGQGLLDLDRATQPVGALGLRTQGRSTGRQPLTGVMAVAGVMGPSSMAVLDDFDRDFEVLLPQTAVSSRWQDLPVSIMTPWVTQAARVDLQALDHVSVGARGDSAAMTMHRELGHGWGTRLSWARTDQDPAVLVRGIWGHSVNSDIIGHDITWQHGAWQAELGWMVSRNELRPGVMTSISAIHSVHARMSLDAGWARFEAGVLPHAVRGQARFQVPQGMDSQGHMQYSEHRSDIRETAQTYWAVALPVTASDLHRVTVAARVRDDSAYQVQMQGNWTW